MKLFAIITAGLMATGGGVYFYSTSTCSKSGCTAPAPVAKTGGCCSPGDKPDCCATQDECCFLQEACCTIATSTNTSTAKVPSCCAAKEECCIVSAACCTVEKVSAKPAVIESCCEACVTPTLTVTGAAKSIASAK